MQSDQEPELGHLLAPVLTPEGEVGEGEPEGGQEVEGALNHGAVGELWGPEDCMDGNQQEVQTQQTKEHLGVGPNLLGHNTKALAKVVLKF